MRIRKSDARGKSDLGWLQSRFSFSFSDYYDPEWKSFGALRVLNEDWISPNSGFGMHSHRDMEIVTVMLSGELHHKDSMGHEQVLKAGEVQSMTAGTGVQHSEWNASATEPTHLYQLWILPRESGLEPTYDQFRPERGQGETILASDGPCGLDINQRAEISRLSLAAGEEYTFKAQDEFCYIQFIEGGGQVGDSGISSGDALLLEKEEQVLLVKDKTELLIIKTGEEK